MADTALPTAAPPYAPPRRTLARAAGQYIELVKVVLTEYRTNWFFHTFFGMVLPLGLIFIYTTTGMAIDTGRAIFLLGGNMATSIAYGPTMMLVGKLGWMRQNRELDYWAALPIPKLVMVLALVTVYMLFALPGVATSYLAGSLMLGLPLAASPLLLVLVPLGALSLAGMGAFLGAYAKDGQTANVIGNALIAFFTFLSPLMIPAELMPAPLRVVALFVPTTYAADAFRAALAGEVGPRILLDALALAGFSAAFLWLVQRKLDWRGA
ncbi:MAG TPA: ABC transporter permease [Roseiflexaceae bacterium]|nr:ABC transporter permease [Roseiflexaceae bacterium]